MRTALIILLSSAPAHAAEVDSQSFLLSTAVEAWPVTDIDSGWWPEDGPIRVRTVLFAEGLAGIDIEGDSIVENGGNGATHRLDHDAAEGAASIELGISASLYLSIDVAGYTWEDLLHEQSVQFDVSQSFDSFAFTEDGGTSLRFPMNTTEVFEVDQGIFPMVDVVVSGSLTPEADMTITTEAIETDNGAFTAEGQRMDTAGGRMALDALGMLQSELNMVLQGHAEVCITWVDCYGDFNYDFTLDPIVHSQELIYDSVTVNHPEMEAAGEPGARNENGNGEGAAGEASGCASAPTIQPSSMLILMCMAALAYRRRQ